MATIAVYITCKNNAEAKRISAVLLKQRLIACANVFPIRSAYWWNGKIATGREVTLLAKTQTKHYANIVKLVKKLHSYQVPCIGKFAISYHKPYAKWLIGQTR